MKIFFELNLFCVSCKRHFRQFFEKQFSAREGSKKVQKRKYSKNRRKIIGNKYWCEKNVSKSCFGQTFEKKMKNFDSK